MENGAGIRSTDQLWEWLFSRAGGKLAWIEDKKATEKAISFQPSYLHHGDRKSQIHFANAKNKVFILADEPGKTLVGYEISFTRHFYRPAPMRTLDEIKADIFAIEQETEGLLEEIVGEIE